MAGPVSWNFTIDDTSPILTYEPYSDGFSLTSGWQTWYSGSGYNAQAKPGDSPLGDSFHLTSLPGASVTLSFYGTGITIYGSSNCSYDVAFDGTLAPNPTPVQSVLFSEADAAPGVHNVTLTARPDNEGQILFFRQAIVTSEVNSTVSTPVSVTYDNQNTTAISYSGNWTPSKIVSGVPSASSSAPFHTTSDAGSSASLNFTGRAVAVYGSSTSGHGPYSVTLDGTERVLNGSSYWLVGSMLLFYQDGLDETIPHSLNMTNLGSGEPFSLSDVVVTQFANAPLTPLPAHKRSTVGAIIGPVVAVATILIIACLFLWARRRYRYTSKSSDRPMFSSSILVPRRFRRKAENVTPFVISFDRNRSSAQSFTSSDASAYFSGQPHGYTGARAIAKARQDCAATPLASPESEMQLPRSLPASHIPRDSFKSWNFPSHSQLPSHDATYPPRTQLSAVNAGPDVPTPTPPPERNLHSIVDRVLELVVQRIDRSPSETDSRPSRNNANHDDNLPPYRDFV